MGKPFARKRLGDVRDVIAGAPTVTEAARRLGVNRSTVVRWLRRPDIPRPGSRRSFPAAAPGQDLGAWVRERFELAPHEEALLKMAEAAHRLALDESQRPSTRLQAMGRFEALVKALNLPGDEDDATQSRGTRRAG